MSAQEFLSLNYKNQLQLISQLGKLKQSFIIDEYQFTLYKVKGFYVELKRQMKELYFEKISAMNYEDLPLMYKIAD